MTEDERKLANMLSGYLDQYHKQLTECGARKDQIGSALMWKIAEMQIDDGMSKDDAMHAMASAYELVSMARSFDRVVQ